MSVAEAVAVFKGVAAAWQFLSVIMQIKDKVVMFKKTLDNLQSILTPLVPVLLDIERLNNELGRPEVELDSLISKMEEGTKLVFQCSKVHRLNCVSRCSYQAQLVAFEESFRNLFTMVMLAQIARDLKENRRNQILSDGTNFLVPETEQLTNRVFAYMLTVPNLYIAWGDTPTYWKRISVSDSRFPVAELVEVCWLEIRGWIKTSMLPGNTRYEAYFVFKWTDGAFGFKNQAIEALVKVAGEGDGQRRTVYLETATPARGRGPFDGARRPLLSRPSSVEVPRERTDGWMEVKLGEFFNGDQEDKLVEMGVHETKDLYWKGGILVQGIEIRLK